MRTTKKAKSPELRAESKTSELAHRRSIAAHKANWTRALRKAFPDGGPGSDRALETYSVHALNHALARKAWERGEVALVAAEEVVRVIRAKQLRRQREMARCAAHELAAMAAKKEAA